MYGPFHKRDIKKIIVNKLEIKYGLNLRTFPAIPALNRYEFKRLICQ